MTVAKLTCPECRTVLKPTKPLPEGKNVTCPKCGTIFAAGAARAPEPVATAKKPNPAAKKPNPAAKKAASAPAKKKPVHHHHDEEDFDTYAVIRDEKEDDEEGGGKPQIEYAPDLSVKDPRGPAQAEVITPTNFLLAVGIIACLLTTISIFWAVFPFLFSDYVVDHKEVLEAYYKDKPQQRKNIPAERKDVDKNQEMKAIVETATDNEVNLRITLIAMWVVGLVYNALVATCAVKMQQLESYRWAMTGAILAMIPYNAVSLLTMPIFDLDEPRFPSIIVAVPAALALLLGIWCLTLLRTEKVRAGFEYVPE
jgi:hypothetical protein